MGLAVKFLDTTPKAWPIKKMMKWISLKFKTATFQETLLREDKPQSRRKYLQNIYLGKDWYLKYTKDS